MNKPLSVIHVGQAVPAGPPAVVQYEAPVTQAEPEPTTPLECAERLALVLGRVLVCEAGKLANTSAGTTAMILNPRELARLSEAFLKLPSLPAQPSADAYEIDYSALTADELEQLRQLRDKARRT